MKRQTLDRLMREYDYEKNSVRDTCEFLLYMLEQYHDLEEGRKIPVDYKETVYAYKMETLDTGVLMNLGGRSLPF